MKPAEGAAPAPAAADPSAASEPDLKTQIGGIQKRIDELTRDRYDARREAEYWRNLAQQRAPEPTQPQATKTLADFDFDEAKYQAFLFEASSQRAVEAAEKKLKEQQERDRAQRRQGEFRSREAKFSETVKDYHETVYSDRVSISEHMAEVIAESEEGPALAYHLGKNPQKAAEIARMSPLQAAREIGRIEANLVAEREKAKAATPKVTQAPSPTPTIEGASESGEKDPNKMTDEEWLEWRNKQIARQRKRA